MILEQSSPGLYQPGLSTSSYHQSTRKNDTATPETWVGHRVAKFAEDGKSICFGTLLSYEAANQMWTVRWDNTDGNTGVLNAQDVHTGFQLYQHKQDEELFVVAEPRVKVLAG